MKVDIAALLRTQRPGMTLDRDFYVAPEIFETDAEVVLLGKWHYVDHVSSVAEPGDFVVFSLCGESVIVVRGQDGEIRGFHNVCRHRGSRLCRDRKGRRRSFVCPYHAWIYDLEGRLVNSRGMPEPFRCADHGLVPSPVRVLEGLIFVNFTDADIPDFSFIADRLQPFLAFHGLDDAKVACERTYSFSANWKLVLDNFHECLHCAPAHRTFSAIHDHAGDDTVPGMAPGRAFDAWEREVRSIGHLTGHLDIRDEFPEQPFRAHRRPFRTGYLTHTTDGRPVAPLMGRATCYDGGHTGIVVEPFFSVQAANDYATVFSIRPIGVRHTEMTLQWLVRGDAREGRDYDVDRMTEVWHVTSLEDERIVDNHQLGVETRAYRPGPYHPKEAMSARVTAWYLAQLRKAFGQVPGASYPFRTENRASVRGSSNRPPR